MLRKKRGSLEWLEFELFQEFDQVRHGTFLRHGGVSEGAYASLNTGGKVGDDPADVRLNREKIRKHLGCKTLMSGQQVHGDRVVHIRERTEMECDGLVTETKRLGLAVMHADCQVAVFYDPVHQAIGCVHAGWRGNVLNIYEKAIGAMHKEFGSKPADLFVGISPSLGPCCGEFLNYEKELPEAFWAYRVIPHVGEKERIWQGGARNLSQAKPTPKQPNLNKLGDAGGSQIPWLSDDAKTLLFTDVRYRPYYFDLWEIGRSQLLKAGILPAHLEIAGICTCCNPADFYSFRREKPTGRHATVISFNDKY